MTTNSVTRDELQTWATRLGFNPDDVAEIRMLPGHVEVTIYRTDDDGHRYVCDCGDVAKEVFTLKVTE